LFRLLPVFGEIKIYKLIYCILEGVLLADEL